MRASKSVSERIRGRGRRGACEHDPSSLWEEELQLAQVTGRSGEAAREDNMRLRAELEQASLHLHPSRCSLISPSPQAETALRELPAHREHTQALEDRLQALATEHSTLEASLPPSPDST